MSKPTIRYGLSAAHTQTELEESKFRVQQYDRERAAERFGVQVMQDKGWNSEEQDDTVYSTRDLYVFTAKELRTFVEAKGGKI